MSTKSQTLAFKDFVPELLDRLQKMTDLFLEEFNEHVAFNYLVADLFETTTDDAFKFTDGPKDGGIDFFIQTTQSYSIYQCKCPNVDILEGERNASKFEKAAVLELISAIRFLQDKESKPDLKTDILRLRTDFQRDLDADPETTTLLATLAIMGELTPAAKELFEAETRKFRDENIILRLITWSDIFRALHEEPTTSDFSIYLYYNEFDKDLLTRRDYFYMLAKAVDLYEAWRGFGWQLFDWNVRLQLHKSNINKRIVSSLMKPKSRKVFHHLNNGILIVCKNYGNDHNQKRMRLTNPQIINGCQTVTAIRDAYESLSPEEQDDFRKNTFVQVKVMTSAADYIEDLIITTNDQNPMNPRNLKSNTAEQKDLQIQFRQYPGGSWFYERKDGEWKSLEQVSNQPRWFKKSNYLADGRRSRYRKIENEQLAKNWYSWIGYSEIVLKGGLDYFSSDKPDIYTNIFKSRPNELFWSEFSSNSYFSPSADHFDPGVASIYEYLLAYTLSQYIDVNRIGWQNCKKQAIQRAVDQGLLKRNPITGQIEGGEITENNFLQNDNDYRIDILMLNIRDILIELCSFILSRRYGVLDAAKSRKLLLMKDISEFSSSAFNLEHKLSLEEQDGKRILGPLYAFIKYCLKQYYFSNKAEILASQRLKAYFYAKKNVGKLREFIILTDREIKDFNAPWKLMGKSFTMSLPDLG